MRIGDFEHCTIYNIYVVDRDGILRTVAEQLNSGGDAVLDSALKALMNVCAA
jgi:hypothetical protein